jgi:predicted amidohydrolase YtcJ
MSFDHHSVVASTGAFRAAGIGLYDADPPHGVICRDGANQEANGVLLESAAARAWNAAPQPSLEQWRIFVVNALNDLASHGFEEVHDMLSPNWLGPMLSELDARGGLPLTAWLYAPLSDLEQQCSAGWSCDRVCLAGGKVFADGTLNSRTAWMLEPFADPMPDHPCGTALMDTSSLARAMRQCNDARVGLAIHAIGDGAVRASLDAAQATGSGGFIGPGLIPRVRIEHCEVIDRTDIARFASLGVVASVQPCHLLPDAPVLRRQLPHRLDRVLPLRELIDSGCRPGELLWFGSDVPIVRPHPCDSFDAAILRRAEGAPPSEAIGIDQAIRIEECVAAFGG